MKTLREFINIVEESNVPEWHAIVAQEVEKRGLPEKVWCGIRYTSYYTFDVTLDDDQTLHVDLEAYGKGDAVSYGPDGDADELQYLYGPGGDVDFQPGYEDNESLCSLITEYCVAGTDSDEGIYYDRNSHWDKGGSFNDAYSDTIDDADDFFKDLAEKSGYEGDYFSFMYAVNNGEIPGVKYAEEDDLNFEREVDNHPLGAAFVVWPGLTLHFGNEGGQVVLKNRGKSHNRWDGKMAPEFDVRDIYQALLDDPKIKADLENRTDTSKKLANVEITKIAKSVAETGKLPTPQDINTVLAKIKPIAAAKE